LTISSSDRFLITGRVPLSHDESNVSCLPLFIPPTRCIVRGGWSRQFRSTNLRQIRNSISRFSQESLSKRFRHPLSLSKTYHDFLHIRRVLEFDSKRYDRSELMKDFTSSQSKEIIQFLTTPRPKPSLFSNRKTAFEIVQYMRTLANQFLTILILVCHLIFFVIN